MSEIQIDHEAAKEWASLIDHVKGNNGNLSRAYLDLHAQLEKAINQLMYIGDKAVVDWDDATVGEADRALAKLPDTYKENYVKFMRRAMVDLPKELETTKEQLAAERRKNGPECPVCDMPMYYMVHPSMGAEGPETQETWRCAHCQLAAERERVTALAELVKQTYDEATQHGWACHRNYEHFDDFEKTEFANNLTAIMDGRDTAHAQGETA